MLRRVAAERTGLELMVTENGAAFDDVPEADGRVHDHDASPTCATTSPPCSGFGIVSVDYAAQRRTPKDSAHSYASTARTNAVARDAHR